MIIDKCPRCFGSIRLPDQLSGISKVRCPLCQAEFELSEALDHLPPAVEVVGAPQLEPVTAELLAEGASSGSLELDERKAVEGTDDSIGFLDVSEDSPSPSEGPEVASAGSPGAFDFNIDAAAHAPAGGRGSTPSMARPKERKSGGGVMSIVKNILGGAAGLVIAFFAILWIPFFPNNDLFGAAKYLPDWMVPEHVQDSINNDGDPVSEEETEPTNNRSSIPRTPVTQENNSSRFRIQANAREGEHPFGLRMPSDNTGTSEPVLSETPNDSENNSPFNIGNEQVEDPQLEFFDPTQPDLLDLGPELSPEDDFIGIRNAPIYEPTELGQAYGAAMTAKQAWSNSNGATPEERRVLGTEFYEALCDMAEKITFVDVGDSTIGSRRDAVMGLLRDIGDNDTDYRLAGILGERHFDAINRSTAGIVIAGTVVGIEKEGELYNTRVELATRGEEKPIHSIMSRINPLEPPAPEGQEPVQAYQVGSKVLICGSIIELPDIRLGGYEGDEPTVIWGGFPVETESP